MQIKALVFLIPIVCLAQFQQTPTPPSGQSVQLPLSGRTGQSGGVVVNQAPIPGVTTSVNTLSTSVQVQPPYNGSVRKGADLPDGKLTLAEAIRRGIASNLGGIGMNNAYRQSLGQARVVRSGLLPNVTANLRETGAGVLVPDARSFVDALVALLSDEGMRRAMAERALQAGAALDWDVLARRFADEVLEPYLPAVAAPTPTH